MRDADPQLAFVFHGVGGVVNQVGPDLVQFAAVGGDFRDVGCKLAADLDAFFQLVLHDRQSGFNAAHDVHLLHRRLVHVGIFLDGFYEGGDAPGAVRNLADDALHFEKCGETHEGGGHGGTRGGEVSLELIPGEIGVHKQRAELPGFGNIVRLQPRGDGFFAVAAFQLVLKCGRLQLGAEFCFDLGDCGAVRLREIWQGIQLAEAREAFEKSVRGAPGCGGRIVEFVSETGGEFAKSGKFVALLLAAGDFADAVGEKSDEALAQRGHALKHFLEEGGGKEKKMDGLFRAAGDGEVGHARKRKQAGDVAFPHNEDRAISAVGLAPREDAALEKNRHVFRGSAFFVDDLTRCEAGFPTIGDEPLQVLLREVGEDGNFSHFVDERL